MLNEEIEMTRQDKQYKRRSESREGLLRAEKAAALRPSLEEACRSSLDSDEHLDELDLNADDKAWDSRWGRWAKRSCLPTRPPWSTGHTYQDSQNKENPNSSRRRRWLARRRSWLIVALILALGFLGLVGSGSFWVYNSAPPDGVRCQIFHSFCDVANLNINSNHRRGIQLRKEVPSALGKRATRKHQPWSGK